MNKTKIYYYFAFTVSILLFFKGIHQFFFYENYTDSTFLSDKSINTYVGGDAYNYIINGVRALCYFVLSSTFLISGILLKIYTELILVVIPYKKNLRPIGNNNDTSDNFEVGTRKIQ